MPLFRRRCDSDFGPDDRSPKLGVKYKDLATLDQLARAGANLDHPRHVLHFLEFASEAEAEAAAEVARAGNYLAEVRTPLEQWPDRWSLVCERYSQVTDAIYVRDAGNFFDRLAADHGGEYDGWEAAVK